MRVFQSVGGYQRATIVQYASGVRNGEDLGTAAYVIPMDLFRMGSTGRPDSLIPCLDFHSQLGLY
jgi:hypothetical protein